MSSTLTTAAGQLVPWVLVRERVVGRRWLRPRVPGRQARVSVRMRDKDMAILKNAQHESLSHALRAVIETYAQMEKQGKTSTHFGDQRKNAEGTIVAKMDFWLRDIDWAVIDRVTKERRCPTISEALRLIMDDFRDNEKQALAMARKATVVRTRGSHSSD
jgi:hypothetical protein